jgi:hypothetical protein
MSHTPPVQEAVPLVELQTLPQMPQLFGLVFRLASQPLLLEASQLAYGAAHVPIVHWPALQVAAAFAKLQTLPQMPQFFSSVWVFASHPVEVSLSQLAKPAVQLAMLQTPAWQTALAFKSAHAKPQEPQLLLSALRLASQPSEGSVLQS